MRILANPFTTNNLAISLAISFALGFLQYLFLAQAMAWVVTNAYPMAGLIELGLRGITLRLTDVAANIVIIATLSLPLAFVLLQLKPKRPYLFAAAAVLPIFLLIWGPVFVGPTRLIESWDYYAIYGWNLLVPYPLAVFFMQFLSARFAHNKSFKNAPSGRDA